MDSTTSLRIGIGGIAIESCTFSPLLSTLDDFTVRTGPEMRPVYPWLPNWQFRDRTDVTFYPCLKAEALSGGEVTADAYATMKTALLEQVQASLPLDGFFLDIHGAMSVVGLDDAEADLIEAIRELVGNACTISAGMDLHGNVTERLVRQVDIFTAYRHAPHIDAMETRERAVALLLECLDSGIRPHRAWVRIPVMLPGEMTTTLVEPARSIYGALVASDNVPGVIDPSLWVGYVWADQARNSATVVVTGTDPDALAHEAETIARRYWDARHQFAFGVPAGNADWTIAEALGLNQKAVFISDSGDNPTAGAPGDAPFMIERLLANDDIRSGRRTAVLATIPSPTAVAACLAAGVGNSVDLMLGGVLDPVNGAPLPVSGTVSSIHMDDPEGGDSAAVTVGGLTIALTSRRKVFFHRRDFEDLAIDVDQHDLIIVKIGYLFPEQQQMASAAYMALTPGAVSLDIPGLPYRKVQRPIFPLDPDMPDPDLTPTLFPPIA